LKKKSAVRTVSLMMAATVLSKLLGMLRSVLLASHYGTTSEAAAFSTASRIPLSFFDILFGSAILGCFVPVYNSLLKKNGEKTDYSDSDRFTCIFFNFILLVTGVFCAAGIVFSDALISLIASDLEPETFTLASRLLKVMFPIVCLAGASYTLVGVLQSKGNFLVPAVISAVSNLCVITYFLFFDGTFGIAGLAAAYLISWAVQFATLAIPLVRSGFRFRLLFDFRDKSFLSALSSSWKVMAGSWFLPFAALIGMDFCLKSGSASSIPAFEYANSFFTIAAGTLTYSICNYLFPSLSEKAAHGSDEDFAGTAGGALFSSVALILPFLCGLFILSENAVAVLYMRGSFGPDSAKQVSDIFTFILPGMPFFAVFEVLSRCFYAKKLSRIPAAASVAAIISDYLLSHIFIVVLGLPAEYAGLAYSLSMFICAAILTVCAVIKIKGAITAEKLKDLLKLVAASAASAAVMLLIRSLIGVSYAEGGFAANLIFCAAVFIPGLTVYAACAALLKEKMIISLFSGIKRSLTVKK